MINKNIKGYSLIEMMIASVLGILLIGAVMTFYLSNKSTNEMRNTNSDIESNARIALLTITKVIEHAGYPSVHVHTIEKPFYTQADGLKTTPKCTEGSNFATMQAASNIYNNNKTTRDASHRDGISIAYMPDNPEHSDAVFWKDCGGSYVDGNRAKVCSADTVDGQGRKATVYNSFYVTSNNELKCTTSRNRTYPIANGIEAIQYLYGVRKLGSTRYKNATNVEADNDWENVISVQVGMLVRSTDKMNTVNKQMRYALLDTTITKNDKYIRKIYNTTIYLKNMDRTVVN
jgi:type IV pilus assembly protein PilW